ncbi:transposase-like protein [Glutamicibacter protophormiae]|uniref:Transposase-like protein n=1 Tax=Glutamicibacter protophormiae TaxID=37930 RepID=A0ABS4XTX9_GLUPR|nr:transposase-like protein [Glutamicibacter protophormiae]GGL89139.1 transposase [Glutamicibacter protophormiae]
MSIASIHPATGTMPENGTMDSTQPRPDQPRRRTITPAQKLAYLQGYEHAIQTGEGRGYLRANGLYSSQIVEWRRLRDAGILDGNTTASTGSAGATKGKLSKEQAEIARLKKQLATSEQKLATTQTALEIMGKAHALLEQI